MKAIGLLAVLGLAAGCAGRGSDDVTFTKVSAGYTHTCAIDDEGAAWCWGSNGYGELGDGTKDDARRPVRVKSENAFVEVAAGRSHTCALETSGSVWCWGSNLVGQVGASEKTALDEPVRVDGVPAAARVAVGNDKTCAVTNGQELWCWGDNSFDQLGVGGAAPRHGQALQLPVQDIGPVEIKHVSTCMAKSQTLTCHDVRFTEDVIVTGFTGFTVADGLGAIDRIESTLARTCVLYDDGKLRCWYRPPYIVDADGKRELAAWPAPVEEDGLYRDIAGADSTLCAVTTTDTILCKGLRPPFSTFLERDKFTLDSPGQKAWVFEDFPGVPADIDGGVAHFCGVNTDGEIWCWGWNARGQLGDGGTVDTTKPVRVDPVN